MKNKAAWISFAVDGVKALITLFKRRRSGKVTPVKPDYNGPSAAEARARAHASKGPADGR